MTIRDCLLISWHASAFYTIVRILLNTTVPILSLIDALICKYILDILSKSYSSDSPRNTLLFFLLLLLITSVIRSFCNKFQSYTQVMHDDIISNDLSMQIMDTAGHIDVEYFDNPDYYDKLNSCMRDASAISDLIWNILSAISSIAVLVTSYLVVSKVNIFYGIIVILAAVPSSIAATKYTKSIYSLSLDQLKSERKKFYLQSLVIDKRFILDLRLFNAYNWVKQKYRHIWSVLFKERRSINRSRSILTGVLECIPLIAIASNILEQKKMS